DVSVMAYRHNSIDRYVALVVNRVLHIFHSKHRGATWERIGWGRIVPLKPFDDAILKNYSAAPPHGDCDEVAQVAECSDKK
uniref:hypothetical protein n=1 Tax=Bartonella sp. CL50QHWL TaxID=3243536 RepID=UPI0035D02E4E